MNGEEPAAPPASASIADALAMAMAAHRDGRLELAETLYRRIVEVAPEHPDALNFLGLLVRQLGERAQALALLERAVAAAPDYVSARINLGNLLVEAGRFEEAETHFRHALAADPRDARVLNNLASIRRRQGHLDEAIALFENAAAAAPEFALPHENLGFIYMNAGDVARAHHHFCHAVLLEPSLSFSRMFTGVALMHLGRIDEAREHFRKWSEDEPSNPIPRHHMLATFGSDERVPARASEDYVRVTFDHFAASFDAHLERLEYQAPRHVAEALAASLPGVAAGHEILDAGCGTGLCGALLRPHARRLVGVDLSPKMLDKARARGHYDVCVESDLVAFMRAHPASFDAIVSADTLCYFGDLAEVAAAAASALRPGGCLVFSVEAAQPAETAGRGYTIRSSGRYCHDEAYLRSILAGGFELREIRRRDLRTEIGLPVAGLIAIAVRAR